jgi:hypothetical protein
LFAAVEVRPATTQITFFNNELRALELAALR